MKSNKLYVSFKLFALNRTRVLSSSQGKWIQVQNLSKTAPLLVHKSVSATAFSFLKPVLALFSQVPVLLFHCTHQLLQAIRLRALTGWSSVQTLWSI